jgi:ParB-like chromosome segregation protein Spo0J
MARTDRASLKVEFVPIDQLTPYARNAKLHDKAQVSQIAESIRQFGFNVPILIDDQGEIIAGHGRWLAAKHLGMTEVPCIRLSHLTATQRKAYRLADNRLTELGGGWDWNTLALEIEELQLDEIALDSLGFDDHMLEKILGPQPPQLDTPAMPSIAEQYLILVSLKTEHEQHALLLRLTQEGYQCRALIS